jgi:hypothetical protein
VEPVEPAESQKSWIVGKQRLSRVPVPVNSGKQQSSRVKRGFLLIPYSPPPVSRRRRKKI